MSDNARISELLNVRTRVLNDMEARRLELIARAVVLDDRKFDWQFEKLAGVAEEILTTEGDQDDGEVQEC